jgi:hypothetical protein
VGGESPIEDNEIPIDPALCDEPGPRPVRQLEDTSDGKAIKMVWSYNISAHSLSLTTSRDSTWESRQTLDLHRTRENANRNPIGMMP